MESGLSLGHYVEEKRSRTDQGLVCAGVEAFGETRRQKGVMQLEN